MTACVIVDFDGTLTTRDSTRFLVIALLRGRPLMIFSFLFWAARIYISSSTEHIQLGKCKLIASLIAGLSGKQLEVRMKGFVQTIKDLVRSDLVHYLRKLRDDGKTILIVTASPVFVVRAVLGNEFEVVGSNFEFFGAHYTGKIEFPICYGENKVACIEEWVDKQAGACQIVEAWSDALSDLPMMLMAPVRNWILTRDNYREFVDVDPDGNFWLAGPSSSTLTTKDGLTLA